MTTLLRTVTLLAFLAAAFPIAAAERISYHHFDALGSTVAVTDEQGNVIWRETYQPYGERIQNQTASANNTRWYTGHSQDPETGLVYAGARYYDPVVGRFYAVDPKGFAENNLQSFSRYAYGNNNPYKYIDPDGQMSVPVAIGVGIFTIAGTIYVGDPERRAQMARDVERVRQNFSTGMQWVGDKVGLLTQPILQEGSEIDKGKTKTKPDREQRPAGLPPGTKPVDKDRRLDREKIHGIKDQLSAGPRDWVGISPDGRIWTNEGGKATDNGPYGDYLP